MRTNSTFGNSCFLLDGSSSFAGCRSHTSADYRFTWTLSWGVHVGSCERPNSILRGFSLHLNHGWFYYFADFAHPFLLLTKFVFCSPFMQHIHVCYVNVNVHISIWVFVSIFIVYKVIGIFTYAFFSRQLLNLCMIRHVIMYVALFPTPACQMSFWFLFFSPWHAFFF